MAGQAVSATVSGFYIGEGTDVVPAHFWSQGPLVNGGRSLQLIIKHDLTHWFYGRKIGVRPTVLVPHRYVELDHLLSQAPLVNDSRSWQLIIQHNFTHWLHGRILVCGSVREPANFWSQGPPVNGGISWQLIVKHDLTHWLHDRKLGVLPSVRVPHK